MDSREATMTDYQLQSSTRRCASTGRELQPGERYFSALIDEGDRFTRLDYSAEAWACPPGRTFSLWQGKLSAAGVVKRPPIDDELLIDCLGRLEEESEPSKLAFRFVLALLLVRRKRLRLEDARREAGREILTVRDTRGGVR